MLDDYQYLKDNQRVTLFKPNESQRRWIEEIEKPGAYIVINAAGNGSGKTYGLVAILAGFAWPEIAPPCFRKEPFTDWKAPKRARIISTPKELEDIGSIQTAIQFLWPKGRYSADKKGKNYYSQYSTDTGWVIDLMSYEQEVSEFAGANIGVLFFNEPMPKPIWDESIARTRSGGLILAAMTSLRDNPWVVDGLLGRANGQDIRVVYGDIEDNCKTHGKNGSLEHSQIERILAQYDPDEREARKTGKPLKFSGRIYKTFDRNVHVAKEIIKPVNGNVSHYMAVDPAIGKPFACVWAYVDVAGVIHVYDEYPNYDFEGAKDSNLTLRDYAALFLHREPKGADITRIIDRHFANSQRNPGGDTLKQEFAKLNIMFIDSYRDAIGEVNEVEAGILDVKQYLRYNTSNPVSTINRPKIIISPHCKNTILSFERWTRDPDTRKPMQEYKDHADCIRYLLSAHPIFEFPKNWNDRKQPHYGVGI